MNKPEPNGYLEPGLWPLEVGPFFIWIQQPDESWLRYNRDEWDQYQHGASNG